MLSIYRIKLLFSIFLLICVYNFSIAQITSFKLGTVLCGAEFGERNLPGELNTNYIYPTKEEVAYFASKGFASLTLPFKWERVQRVLGGSLDTMEVSRMKQFIITCNEANIKVILTLQNFACYTINNDALVIGSKKLPYSTYKDFWKQLATALTDSSHVNSYDIMNEPRNIFGRHWRKAAQSAIDGIREADKTSTIIIDGENSSFSQDWAYDNNKLRKLKDPSDKLIYDAHCYFDYDHSGRYDGKYESGINTNIGIERVKPFIKWLKRHHKKGMIGEFGVPADGKWLETMDKFLAYLQENGLDASYWAAGPWWHDYPLSVEPVDGIDKPQMKILEKYLPVKKQIQVAGY